MKANLLLSALAFLALSCGRNHESKSSKISGEAPVTYSTNFIPADTANRMIESYLESLPAPDTQDLHFIEFTAADLRDYLRDTNIKSVRVNLAHTLSYINSGNFGEPAGYRVNSLTFIITGANGNGTAVPAPNGLYLNKGFPCPPYCPTSAL